MIRITILISMYISFAVSVENTPIEAYGKLSVVTQMGLSPDGDFIASIRYHDGIS